MKTFLLFCLLAYTPFQENQSPSTLTPNDSEIQQVLKEMIADSIEMANKKQKFDSKKGMLGFDVPIPAVIAGYQKHGQPIRIGAAGVRKLETDVAVTPDDLVHIGSCTKAMTATLIGRLVDQGKLTFETTIEQGLPHLADQIHEDYHDVTIHQLLTHRGCVPRDGFWGGFADDDINTRRDKIVIKALAEKPEQPINNRFGYSNLGYCIAGMIAAKTEDMTWEQLIEREIFDPLDMKSASFGPPGTTGKIDQPWGHAVLGMKLMARQGDNPPPLGPAGTVHLTISDWAKFALAHAGCSDPPIVTDATLKKLHEIVNDPIDENDANYACGWGVMQRPWARGTALTHSGSNTMWHVTVWVAPKNKSAYFAAINAGINHGIVKATNTAIEQVIEIHRKAYEKEQSR